MVCIFVIVTSDNQTYSKYKHVLADISHSPLCFMCTDC